MDFFTCADWIYLKVKLCVSVILDNNAESYSQRRKGEGRSFGNVENVILFNLNFYIQPNMSRHNKQGYTYRAWHSGYTSSYKITEDKQGAA